MPTSVAVSMVAGWAIVCDVIDVIISAVVEKTLYFHCCWVCNCCAIDCWLKSYHGCFGNGVVLSQFDGYDLDFVGVLYFECIWSGAVVIVALC